MERLIVFSNYSLPPTPGYLSFFNVLLSNDEIEFVDNNNPKKATFSVSFNHVSKDLKTIESLGIPLNKRFLVILECESILPEMHNPKILQKYGHIFSPSPFWATSVSPEIIRYPFKLQVNPNKIDLKLRPINLGLVQRNKFSFHPKEMYTFRRQVIRNMLKIEKSFSVRGEGWDVSKLEIIKGFLRELKNYLKFKKLRQVKFNQSPIFVGSKEFRQVDDKQEFLAQVKIAIVIENSLDYVSEKLFDCLRSGTVPLYIGPDLGDFGIPKTVTLQSAPDLESIARVVQSVTQEELEMIALRGKDFLEKTGQEWDEVAVMKDLASRINNKL